MTRYKTSTCRDARCTADIIWAVTSASRRMPVDATPEPDGNILLTLDGGDTTPTATVVNPDAPPLGGWPGTLHHSHFETCEAADQFRKPRPRNR